MISRFKTDLFRVETSWSLWDKHARIDDDEYESTYLVNVDSFPPPEKTTAKRWITVHFGNSQSTAVVGEFETRESYSQSGYIALVASCACGAPILWIECHRKNMPIVYVYDKTIVIEPKYAACPELADLGTRALQCANSVLAELEKTFVPVICFVIGEYVEWTNYVLHVEHG